MSEARSFSRKVAIAGIGATEFSKNSGRSTMRLAIEATKAALDDAGLPPVAIDGIVSFTHETNPEIEIARNLGIPALRYISKTAYGGGGACATIQHAAVAIAAGAADVVLCYRAFNERSETRFGGSMAPVISHIATPEAIELGWSTSFGLGTPAAFAAMFARRYMHEYGATSEDLGRISVIHRRHASTNPRAWFHGRPITLEDHQRSPWIVEPLHLLDCCQETDGGVAVIVTTTERARDLRQRPALVAAAAQGSATGQGTMSSFFDRRRITDLPEMKLVADQLWAMAGIGQKDVQAAILYDHFTPFVLLQLEALGFCEAGQAPDFIARGGIDLDGALPVNPHGGQLGEAYLHGVNGISEAVRQLRGTAANQLPDPYHILVTGGGGVPTSGLVLARD